MTEQWVVILTGLKDDRPRVRGYWSTLEEALKWATEWWKDIFTVPYNEIERFGKHSDDRYATIEGAGLKMTVCESCDVDLEPLKVTIH